MKLGINDKAFSPEDYKEMFEPQVKDMSVLRRIDDSPSSLTPTWCIVLVVQASPSKSDILYLYLTKTDSSFVFSQLPNTGFENVAFWDKKGCLQTADYIRTQRANKAPTAPGIIKSYNPYTGDLI